jgi:tetratricopeptide (TPR) repeat protein
MNRDSYTPLLSIGLLLVVAFILAVSLSVRQDRSRIQQSSNSITAQLLGDSRRLFANQFFTKADEYFHRGYYPSMFDQAAVADKTARPAMTIGAVGGNAHEGEVEWMNQPRDWIERFSRHFFPSVHTHLDDGPHDKHDHDGDGVQDHAAEEHDLVEHEGHVDGDEHPKENSDSNVSEILPWLKIAAELNPDRADIYVTGAYYLRNRLDQVDEAEEFLREGWRRNPKSPAIIFELGRIKEENRNRPDLARNLYRLAIRYWIETESTKEEPDELLMMQILMHSAKAERAAGNTEIAVRTLRQLRTISPHPESIDRLIEEYQAAPIPFVHP